jgi:hypothetical protein
VTSATARTVANVLVLTAGAAAAYVVLTTPPLRRLAFRASKIWLGASLPVFLLKEVGKAWAESSRLRDESSRPI